MVSRNWPVKTESQPTIAKLNVIFRRKRNGSRGRNISKGSCVGKTVSHVTNAHPTHSQTTQAWLKAAIREAGKVSKKAKKNQKTHLSLAAKCRTESFHNDCWASGDMLFRKFCRDNVGWKHVDVCKNHLWSLTRRNMMRHTISNGNTGIKGTERALDVQVLQNRWTKTGQMRAGWQRMRSRGQTEPGSPLWMRCLTPTHTWCAAACGQRRLWRWKCAVCGYLLVKKECELGKTQRTRRRVHKMTVS